MQPRNTPHVHMPLFLLGLGMILVVLVLFGRDSLFANRADLFQGTGTDPSIPTADGWPALALGTAVEGFVNPVHITHAGDGSGRRFVVEQEGRIRIIKDGTLLTEPFLDITTRVGCCGERGLLSVAFPPGYAQEGHFYVNYTNTAGDTVVARYRLTANPDRADPNSEQVILSVDQPYANHNGGQLAFGPDGYLYIGMGDGGSGGDPQNRAQNPQDLLGKLLRIDVESGSTAPYTIPPTNPFTRTTGYRPEIWALGLRNPWRFSFDRTTGDLYMADVGQNAYEEVNFQPASSKGGENYGWSCKEGTHDYNLDRAPCNDPDFLATLTAPIHDYSQDNGDRSVTGGVVYRGAQYARMQGIYFYGDYASGRIWGLRRNGSTWENTLLLDNPFAQSSFGEDEAGNLYLADYSGGRIIKLIDNAPTSPTPTARTPRPSPTRTTTPRSTTTPTTDTPATAMPSRTPTGTATPSRTPTEDTPATATPTAGTPATPSITATGTPATATPSITATGTPATPSITATGTPATATPTTQPVGEERIYLPNIRR